MYGEKAEVVADLERERRRLLKEWRERKAREWVEAQVARILVPALTALGWKPIEEEGWWIDGREDLKWVTPEGVFVGLAADVRAPDKWRPPTTAQEQEVTTQAGA